MPSSPCSPRSPHAKPPRWVPIATSCPCVWHFPFDNTLRMSHGTEVPTPVLRVDGERSAHHDDVVAAEEPLEIRLAFGLHGKRSERALSVTMRTPGADLELAAGFLVNEGLVGDKQEIPGIHHCGPAIRADGTSNVGASSSPTGTCPKWRASSATSTLRRAAACAARLRSRPCGARAGSRSRGARRSSPPPSCTGCPPRSGVRKRCSTGQADRTRRVTSNQPRWDVLNGKPVLRLRSVELARSDAHAEGREV